MVSMSEKHTKSFSKILSILLYSLPILFFIICYFMIVTSGEDIFQGANTPANIIGDAVAAFKHSARLGDMYAWSVINIFDYTYSFGPDTIFRLIDVLSAALIFYLTTFIVIGKKPGLNLKDATIFGLAFLMVILTPHGRILYAGFSAIHNYLIMMLFLLLFAVPYIIKTRKPEIIMPKWFSILMLLLGAIFGISSNIAPLAVLVTGALVGIFQLAIKKAKIRKNFWLSWEFLGFLGVAIGILFSFLVGPGLTDYVNNPDYVPTYDYLSFSDLFSSPISGIVTIIKHMISNFGRVLLPILALAAVFGIFFTFYRKSPNFEKKKFSNSEKNVLFVAGVFTLIFICGNFQLFSPIRALLPGYFGAAICFLILLRHLFDGCQKGNIIWLFGGVAIILISGTVAARFILSIDYLSRTSVVLEKIQTSESSEICISPEEIRSKTLPFVYLGQEDMLADWAVPETIYGKKVGFCPNGK